MAEKITAKELIDLIKPRMMYCPYHEKKQRIVVEWTDGFALECGCTFYHGNGGIEYVRPMDYDEEDEE